MRINTIEVAKYFIWLSVFLEILEERVKCNLVNEWNNKKVKNCVNSNWYDQKTKKKKKFRQSARNFQVAKPKK